MAVKTNSATEIGASMMVNGRKRIIILTWHLPYHDLLQSMQQGYVYLHPQANCTISTYNKLINKSFNTYWLLYNTCSVANTTYQHTTQIKSSYSYSYSYLLLLLLPYSLPLFYNTCHVYMWNGKLYHTKCHMIICYPKYQGHTQSYVACHAILQ